MFHKISRPCLKSFHETIQGSRKRRRGPCSREDHAGLCDSARLLLRAPALRWLATEDPDWSSLGPPPCPHECRLLRSACLRSGAAVREVDLVGPLCGVPDVSDALLDLVARSRGSLRSLLLGDCLPLTGKAETTLSQLSRLECLCLGLSEETVCEPTGALRGALPSLQRLVVWCESSGAPEVDVVKVRHSLHQSSRFFTTFSLFLINYFSLKKERYFCRGITNTLLGYNIAREFTTEMS